MYMKINSSYRITISLLILLISFSLHAQVKGFEKIKWEKKKIAPGLVWKSSHAFIGDTVLQNINILIVNTGKRDVSLIYNPERNTKTSTLAAEAGAIAAINAGFFNVKDGGSVTYIKVDGLLIDSDTATKWKRVANMNGSVIIDSSGNVHLMKAMPNSWYDSRTGYRDVLITGPHLLTGGMKATLPETSLVINKHPRSCIGLTSHKKIILLTLDGRTEQAAGMTLLKLADLMVSLKCTDAVNLDGGGSTTMWIKDQPFNGVVNMPCDNKKFDHEGERAVSNILIIR